MKLAPVGSIIPLILKHHRIANVLVNDAGEMTAIHLEDGRSLDGIENAGMVLDPENHSILMLRLEISGPITINGKPAVDAFKAELERIQAAKKLVHTPPTDIIGPDGKPLT